VIKRRIIVGASGARSRPRRRSHASVDVLLHKSCDVLPVIGCGYAVGLQGECHFASHVMVGVGTSSAKPMRSPRVCSRMLVRRASRAVMRRLGLSFVRYFDHPNVPDPGNQRARTSSINSTSPGVSPAPSINSVAR
jgi:hypothetical protein